MNETTTRLPGRWLIALSIGLIVYLGGFWYLTLAVILPKSGLVPAVLFLLTIIVVTRFVLTPRLLRYLQSKRR